MRKTFLALFLLSACVLSGCQQPAAEANKSVFDEVIAREKASFDAWKRNDKAFYDDYWATNMTEFMPDQAALSHRPEMMARFEEMAGKWKLDSVEMLNPEVQVLGTVAILTYNEQVSGSLDGASTKYAGKVTMVYVKQRGVWRGVHSHESK